MHSSAGQTGVPVADRVGTILTAALLGAAAGASAPLRAQSLPRIEAVARIGCELCDGPEAFASIERLATGPDGNIRGLDSAEPFVRVFTPRGDLVRHSAGPVMARVNSAIRHSSTSARMDRSRSWICAPGASPATHLMAATAASGRSGCSPSPRPVPEPATPGSQ